VSYWSETDVHAQLLVEFFEEVAVKQGAIVHGELSGYPKAAHNLLPKEVFDCLRGYYAKWFDSNLFCEVLYCDNCVAKVSQCCW
jgi:hypothetical protein